MENSNSNSTITTANEERRKMLGDHKFFSVIIVKAENTIKDNSIKEKIYSMVDELYSNNINLKKVRSYIPFDLLSYQPSLRSLIWKVSLNYLPSNSDKWEEYLDEKRDEYQSIKDK